MADTLSSKIRRSEKTAETFNKIGRYYLSMARKGAGDFYYQYAEDAFARAERCREAVDRLKR